MMSVGSLEGSLLGIILVAVKFSQKCERAVAMGTALARFHSSRLEIVHVLNPTPCGAPLGTHSSSRQIVEEDVRKRFHSLYGRVIDDIPCYLHVVWGDPGVEICKEASRLHADLIVLGCHQSHRAIGVTRLGLVGNRIVEGAPCPVLIVPSHERI